MLHATVPRWMQLTVNQMAGLNTFMVTNGDMLNALPLLSLFATWASHKE